MRNCMEIFGLAGDQRGATGGPSAVRISPAFTCVYTWGSVGRSEIFSRMPTKILSKIAGEKDNPCGIAISPLDADAFTIFQHGSRDRNYLTRGARASTSRNKSASSTENWQSTAVEWRLRETGPGSYTGLSRFARSH